MEISLESMIANMAQGIADAVYLTAATKRFDSKPHAARYDVGDRVFAWDQYSIGTVVALVGPEGYRVRFPAPRELPQDGESTLVYTHSKLRSADFTTYERA